MPQGYGFKEYAPSGSTAEGYDVKEGRFLFLNRFRDSTPVSRKPAARDQILANEKRFEFKLRGSNTSQGKALSTGLFVSSFRTHAPF